MNQISKHFLTGILVVILIGAAFLPYSGVTGAPLATSTQVPGRTVRLFLPAVISPGIAVGNPGPSATATPAVAPTVTGTVAPSPTLTMTPLPSLTPTPTSTPLPTPLPGTNDPVLLAAGDIARCGGGDQAATAKIINKYPSAAVAILGDNAYESGTLSEYQTCYNPTWGAFKNRTYPAPGNHDFLTAGGAGYYSYFGAAAGTPGKGYYSYSLGTWHIIVLNSTCGDAGGCGSTSAQGKWLKADLAAHPTQCSLAYFHHPYYSSGEWGNITNTQPLIQMLYNAKVELMLSGHDHDYERFAPQNLSGGLDTAKGIVQFVAGTGGSNNTPWTVTQPNSLVRNNTTFGVLKLTLHPTSYDWQYIPVSGTFKDSGTAACH